jgi:hypothetical protein
MIAAWLFVCYRERSTTKRTFEVSMPPATLIVKVREEPLQQTHSAKRVSALAGRKRVWAGAEGSY